MTVGAAVSTLVATSSAGTATFQPSAGTEWVVHGLYQSTEATSVDWYLNTATTSLKFIAVSTGENMVEAIIHVSTATWLTAVNSGTGTVRLGISGVQSV